MEYAQNTGMNRNFTAFCAAMLAFAILLVICGGYWADSRKFSLAENENSVKENENSVKENENSVNESENSVNESENSVKTVYLTFDDGPSDRVTPKILDVLAEEGVKATFFIIGCQAETRKYILERELNEGHTIAVHSYTHKYAEIFSSPENLIKDIDKCNEVIKNVTGEYSSIYRFPGGSYGLSSGLISAVTAHGMRYVDWNASTRDAEIYCATPEQVFKAATAVAASTENIVLLAHDSTTKSATAAALKDIIRYYKNEGYIFEAF